MTENELRIGNWVLDSNGRQPTQIMPSDFSATICTYLEPIPLTEEWLVKMKDNKNKTPFPDWIKYVHEAQNWYYWNNNKTELTIKER